MAVVGFTKLEALFRASEGLDIHKGDAKEITDIIEQKLQDLLIAGERIANLNGRDVILESDVPITKGLQETIIAFRKLEESIPLEDILEHLASVPPLKYPLAVELEEKLPEITGAILITLAKIIKVINGGGRTFSHEDIKKAKEIVDLTL